MINRVNTKVEIASEIFPEELKELIQKKENIYEDLDEKIEDRIWETAKEYWLGLSPKILKELEKNAPESMKGIYKRIEAEKAIIARIEKAKGKQEE